jgi:peptidoglycan/LPS O-acetylase OafA/YrhL
MSIDSTRALAIILVLLFHNNFIKFGYLGVDIFLIISGYVLFKSIDSKNDNYSDLGHRFLLKRIRRLLPSYFFILFSIFVLIKILIPNATSTNMFIEEFKNSIFLNLNSYYMNVDNDYFKSRLSESPFTHFWSLSVEFKYALFLSILLMVNKVAFSIYEYLRSKIRWKHRSRKFMFRIIYYFSFFIIVVLLIQDRDLNFYSTKLRIAEIMIGGIVYDLVAIKKNQKYKLFRSLAYFFVSTSIFIIFMLLISENKGIMYFFTLLFTIIILIVTNRFQEIYFLNLIGKASYAIYLVHYPISKILISNRLISMLIQVALGIIFYHLFDKYFQNRLKSNYKHSKWVIILPTIILSLNVVYHTSNLNWRQEFAINNNFKNFEEYYNYQKSIIDKAKSIMELSEIDTVNFYRSKFEDDAYRWDYYRNFCFENKMNNYKMNSICTIKKSTTLNSSKILIIGDSNAGTLVSYVYAKNINKDNEIVVLAREACPYLDLVPSLSNGKIDQNCLEFNAIRRNYILNHSTEFSEIYIQNMNFILAYYDDVSKANYSQLSYNKFKFYNQKMLENLLQQIPASRINFVELLPNANGLRTCNGLSDLVNNEISKECFGDLNSNLVYRQYLKDLTIINGVNYIETSSIFCTDKCNPIFEGLPLYWESSHMNSIVGIKLAEIEDKTVLLN